MAVIIFHKENNSVEEWLQVNDDETVTHHIENSGWPMVGSGLLPRDMSMTAQMAKIRWSSYAGDIDSALVRIATEK